MDAFQFASVYTSAWRIHDGAETTFYKGGLTWTWIDQRATAFSQTPCSEAGCFQWMEDETTLAIPMPLRSLSNCIEIPGDPAAN